MWASPHRTAGLLCRGRSLRAAAAAAYPPEPSLASPSARRSACSSSWVCPRPIAPSSSISVLFGTFAHGHYCELQLAQHNQSITPQLHAAARISAGLHSGHAQCRAVPAHHRHVDFPGQTALAHPRRALPRLERERHSCMQRCSRKGCMRRCRPPILVATTPPPTASKASHRDGYG